MVLAKLVKRARELSDSRYRSFYVQRWVGDLDKRERYADALAAKAPPYRGDVDQSHVARLKQDGYVNLANIIQARMSEIMDFVTYHLKQVGLDSRALNGGIVMTGGGSQLRHLIQLTEYVTGLNARIGYPTEHLAAGHIEELAKPTYSTCIGLILKGYSDYEHNRKQFDKEYRKVDVPDNLKRATVQQQEEAQTMQDRELLQQEKVRNRKGIKDFWGKFKDGIIDLFKEEEDHAL